MIWFHAAVGIVAGVICALVFFEGLWWTVRRAETSRRPAALFVVSFLVRAAAFALVATSLAVWSPLALAGAAIGFWIGRRVGLSRHSEATT